MSRELSTTLVCFAVKEEASFFKRLVGANSRVEVLITGMGRVNAERAVVSALRQRQPRRLVTAGFAGGLNPELPHGTVVYEADANTSLLDGLRKTAARPARFHCAEKVASTSQSKRLLWTRTGADAVEMESGVIRDLCRKDNIPAATIRVILDTATEDLALDFNQVLTPDMRIDPARMALYLLRAPWKVPALVRLQKQSAAAAALLADVLQRVLASV